MAIEEEVRALQSKIQIEQSKKARAEVEHENAEKQIQQARAVLKEKFGITTSDDIRAKRAELEATLAENLASAKSALEAAGA
jgi:hypothetical protein